MRLIHGDSLKALAELEDGSVQTCVTSPPYWGLRDYGADGQLGLEATPDEYVDRLVHIFREVRRALRKDGTLWLNLGDSYAVRGNKRGKNGEEAAGLHQGRGCAAATTRRAATAKDLGHAALKEKDLVGIPWAAAFALRADGWFLRADIIWSKPNCMPSSVRDRPTTSHEYVFLLSKRASYYYDADAVREPQRRESGKRMEAGFRDRYSAGAADAKGFRGAFGGKDGMAFNPEGRNRRSVWTVTTSPYKGAHFATYPPKLIRPCILAGSRPGDTVLDPFNGAGTTGLVAMQLRRDYVGIDVNADYLEMTRQRLAEVQPELFTAGGAGA